MNIIYKSLYKRFLIHNAEYKANSESLFVRDDVRGVQVSYAIYNLSDFGHFVYRYANNRVS
jgi:hypothetical protein